MKRDEILANLRKRVKTVNIPGLGDIQLRPLPASYLGIINRIQQATEVHESEKPFAMMTWRVALCWVDENGERIYDNEHAKDVIELERSIIDAIVAEIDKANSIPTPEQAEKNSVTTPGASSATSSPSGSES